MLSLSTSLALGGCSKSNECNIAENHAHWFINEDNLGVYILSESEKYYELNKTNKIINVINNDNKLSKFLAEKDLFKISDNKKIIDNIIAHNKDHIEYEYKYKSDDSITINDNNVNYDWTSDRRANVEFIGKTRICHCVYSTYKIEEKRHGYITIKSEYYDDFNKIPGEYDYIGNDFYEIVYISDKKRSREEKVKKIKKQYGGKILNIFTK